MQQYKEYRGWYDVQEGQRWSFEERHDFTCQSALHHQSYPGAALCFVDPPWNQGNLTTFYGKADKVIDITFAELIDGLAARIQACHTFVEMGKQKLDETIALFEAHGHHLMSVYPATYYQKRPCYVIHFADDNTRPTINPAREMDDSEWPEWAIATYTHQHDLVIDPCCGRGLIPTSAAKLNRRSWSNELNPIRLCITLEKMTDILGYAPTNDSE